MKTIAYAIAGIAALGIMIVLIAAPSSTSSSSSTEKAPATSVSAEHAVLDEAGTLTLEIPSMHCQFACYPRVKETLEHAGGVSEVALAEQPDPDTLTLKQVRVSYKPGFDFDAAMASLEQEGFGDATRIE